MSEPVKENAGIPGKLIDKLWPFRVPVIFGFIAIFFFSLALINIYLSQADNQSIIIEQSDTESASESGILVDVSGAIVNPGVYELPFQARLKDAIVRAGGFVPETDSEYIAKNLNLAARLTDGAKIYIPFQGEKRSQNTVGNNTGVQNTASQININSASISELDTLPGVGPATAQKIIDGRPYQSIDDLLNKKITGKSVFEKIKEKITIY